jgi:transcription elongation factor GreB
MSKAFVRESDASDEAVPQPVLVLPSGTRNYLTADGAERLRLELTQLVEFERPKLASDPGDPDLRRQLQVLDQRIRHLQHSLATGEIVPATPSAGTARFGDTVTVRESDGTAVRYRIVGVDEAGLESHWIGWQSPLAKALLNARQGDKVSFQTPRGTAEVEVLEIH